MTSGPPKAADGGTPGSSTSPTSGTPSTAQPSGSARPISSDALFGGASEVQITHRGSLYRLKQTALGKLILTK